MTEINRAPDCGQVEPSRGRVTIRLDTSSASSECRSNGWRPGCDLMVEAITQNKSFGDVLRWTIAAFTAAAGKAGLKFAPFDEIESILE